MNLLIKDRHGRVFEFAQERIEGLVYFKLFYRKVCAAYANCHLEDEVLVLADIFVEDKGVVGNPDLIWRLLGRKTLAVNFRRQGIGSQLLTTVVAYAKSKGLRRIEGTLAGIDLGPDSKLPNWFKKRGFTVKESFLFKDLGPVPLAAFDETRYMPKR